ncbi:hypothetical protein [Effusibacillus consociatus]|uniref:Uncharacterized protein n=1 Tax=Effusibacillus consociatus TaxID=1117041 RepID=A0ABV9QB92_9BACL
MTALIKIGGKIRFLDPLIKTFMSRFMFEEDDLLQHVPEEGQYLVDYFSGRKK